VKSRYFCPILTKFGFPRQIFIDSSISNFTEICPAVDALVHADRGKDRPADGHDKVIDPLRDHANEINMP